MPGNGGPKSGPPPNPGPSRNPASSAPCSKPAGTANRPLDRLPRCRWPPQNSVPCSSTSCSAASCSFMSCSCITTPCCPCSKYLSSNLSILQRYIGNFDLARPYWRTGTGGIGVARDGSGRARVRPLAGQREQSVRGRAGRLAAADRDAEQERGNRRRRPVDPVGDLAGQVEHRPPVHDRLVDAEFSAGRVDPLVQRAHRLPPFVAGVRAKARAAVTSSGVSQSSHGGAWPASAATATSAGRNGPSNPPSELP